MISCSSPSFLRYLHFRFEVLSMTVFIIYSYLEVFLISVLRSLKGGGEVLFFFQVIMCEYTCTLCV